MNIDTLVIECVELAGSQSNLALALKTSRQNVSNWVNGRNYPNTKMFVALTKYHDASKK